MKLSLSPSKAKKNLFDYSPVNILTCCPQTFKIEYANETSKKTLNSLTHLLPSGVNGNNIVGQSIDVFHKNPQMQRHLLSNPNAFPHKAIIRLGHELLELHIEAEKNNDGKIINLILSWNIVTEREQLKIMVDNMPINVMMCDCKDFKITYANRTSFNTLKQVEHLLPIKANSLIGQCIDIFHKDPMRIRQLLKDPKNLPHSAKIKLQNETLKLDVSAVIDKTGYYIGPMVCWQIITEQERLSNEVLKASNLVNQLESMSQDLASAAEQGLSQSNAAYNASEDASSNMGTIAAAAEEMTGSIKEISEQTNRSSSLTSDAVIKAENAGKTITKLKESADRIGDVLTLISDIAEQTNLLALNATIEAARAGEAGKGFAVVANEVKSLASQTAQATEDIRAQILSMQSTTQDSVTAIEAISKSVMDINGSVTSIASAMEEQSSVTMEISRSTQAAAVSTHNVSKNVEGVKTASELTAQSSEHLLENSRTLFKTFEALKKLL